MILKSGNRFSEKIMVKQREDSGGLSLIHISEPTRPY